MKKLFTLAAAVLASVSMWAATETQPSEVPSKDNAIVGTSYTIAGAYNAGSGNQLDPMTSGGVKFRLNKNTSGISNAIEFTVNEGYKITSIAFCGYANDNSKVGTLEAVYIDGTEEANKLASIPSAELPNKKSTPASFTINGFEATSKVIVAFSSTNLASQGCIEYTITYDEAKTCTDPEAHLAFTKSTAYVGEQFTYDYGSKSGGDLSDYYTLNGVPAVKGTDYTFTSGNITVLKAGQFVMHMITAAQDDYCAADLSDTILIYEATPVTEVTVDGPAAGFVGQELTYTATAEGATDYQWLVDGVDANTNAATFTYTAVKGDHTIVCKARNEFNAEDAWIASDPIALKVTNASGTIISYALETASGNIDKDFTVPAGINNVIGGTGHQKTQKDKKLGSNGHYVSLKLANGSFQMEDTVKIFINLDASVPARIVLSSDANITDTVGIVTGLTKENANPVVITLIKDVETLYLARTSAIGQNPTVDSIAVIRPEQPDHVDVSLVGVTIDGEELPSDFVTHLINEGTFTIHSSYVDAPTVTFVKHSDIYYEGESEPVSKNENIEVIATEVAGEWQAQATIGENTYTITLAKTASFTVHYMDGENELGTESVAANGTVAKYADFQSKTLSTFVGWYQDVDLTIEANLETPITAETYLYAKFENKYAASINIEQLVLDNGKSYDLLNALGTNGYATNWTNDLDSLNNEKTLRNYAFLGQKVKAAGKMIDFRLAQGSTVKVKFGNAPADIKVVINGVENTVEAAALATPYEYTAAEETYISIRSTATSTLVFKQIMINEDIQTVVLPALYTVTYNAGAGECEVATAETQFSGDVVILPAATREGYTFDGWFDAAEEGELIGVAGAEYTPSADITLFAQYTEEQEEQGCDWSALSWLGDGSPEQTYSNQFKVCVGDPAPSIVNIQKPGFASETGIYITFPSAGFTSFSLDATMYDLQGAGIIFHLSAFSNKETEVTVVCEGKNYVFTVYNEKGIATAIDNTEAAVKAQKVLRDGQLYIIYNGKTYNVQGAAVK